MACIQLDFQHQLGQHCSSTSIKNVLRYYGTDWSEALIFGLGSGLGFVYWLDESASPTRLFNGRAGVFEEKFFANIGYPLDWVGTWDIGKMEKSLMHQQPILAQTNILNLPYYTPANFPGHGIAIVGFEPVAKQVIIADIISEELQEISYQTLEQAMQHTVLPMMKPYHWAAVPPIEPQLTPNTFRKALQTMLQEMMHHPAPHVGLSALAQLADDLPYWDEASDWDYAARFGYQAIEKRGTGGGAFRKLYADFLEEASEYLTFLAEIDSKKMQHLAALWQELAHILRCIYKDQNANSFDMAGQITLEIYKREKEFCEDLAKKLAN